MTKILIVDDSRFMRGIVRNIVIGHKLADPFEAGSGKEALATFAQERPDLVLLDIIMPDIGGNEILKDIKHIDPNAKVIMITAVGLDAMKNECDQAGVKGYITKPFNEEKVVETIKKVLK